MYEVSAVHIIIIQPVLKLKSLPIIFSPTELQRLNISKTGLLEDGRL